MQYTISLFKHFYNNLPPLISGELRQTINEVLTSHSLNLNGNLDEVEDDLVMFGYIVWPWQKAHNDYLNATEEKFAEHWLLPKLSQDLQKKYHDFKLYGGTLNDLKSGNAAINFTEDERLELARALVELKSNLRRMVDHEVMSLEKTNYLKKVAKYGQLLVTIKQSIAELKQLAAEVQDHPTLANEMMAKAKLFEHGLCSLAPEPNLAEVQNAKEFFAGRRHELNRLKGINLPQEIDFFA